MIQKCTTALFLMLSFGIKAEHNNKLLMEELLQSEVNSMGQKIRYPEVKDAKVIMKKITFPPGETIGWHKHDIPVFSYIIKGILTVETEDGTNKESTNLVVMAIYLGGDARELSIKKE